MEKIEFGMDLLVIWDRAGLMNALEWGVFWKRCMDGNKVRKDVLIVFLKNLVVLLVGEIVDYFKGIGKSNF